MKNATMAKQMSMQDGFIAALDQSGGSTPKALKLYGVPDDAYSNDEEMFALIHAMRARIVKSPAFVNKKVIGTILFEGTMDDEIDGRPTADYLWQQRGIVPFLKVDKGLEAEKNGVQLMKEISGLDALLKRASDMNLFGTKMRSVINAADRDGIEAITAQQFEVAYQILSHDLMPILEPEINIKIADKAEAEELLLVAIQKHLAKLPDGKQIMLKLSLPTKSDLYRPLVEDPRIMRVVALSGGYSRREASSILSRNVGVIASFSRALTEGLSVAQSEDEFNAKLAEAIGEIYEASCISAPVPA